MCPACSNICTATTCVLSADSTSLHVRARGNLKVLPIPLVGRQTLHPYIIMARASGSTSPFHFCFIRSTDKRNPPALVVKRARVPICVITTAFTSLLAIRSVAGSVLPTIATLEPGCHKQLVHLPRLVSSTIYRPHVALPIRTDRAPMSQHYSRTCHTCIIKRNNVFALLNVSTSVGV